MAEPTVVGPYTAFMGRLETARYFWAIQRTMNQIKKEGRYVMRNGLFIGSLDPNITTRSLLKKLRRIRKRQASIANDVTYIPLVWFNERELHVDLKRLSEYRRFIHKESFNFEGDK